MAQTRGSLHKAIQALEQIKQGENALEANDLNLLQTPPMLSSLTSLVLHDVRIVDISRLEVLSLKPFSELVCSATKSEMQYVANV